MENVFFVWSLLIVCDVFWGCIEFVLIWIKGYVKFFFWKESLIIGENINVGNFNCNYFVVLWLGCMVWEYIGVRFDLLNYMNVGFVGVKNCIF